MKSRLGIVFTKFDIFWQNLRFFAFRNKSLFEIGFTLLYAFEQGILIWYTFYSQNIQNLSLVISLFAIVVLTTFALHKMVMESRIKVLEGEISKLYENEKEVVSRAQVMSNKYDELMQFVQSQSLNNRKSKKNTRGEANVK